MILINILSSISNAVIYRSHGINKINYLLLLAFVKSYPAGINHNKHSKWQVTLIHFPYSLSKRAL